MFRQRSILPGFKLTLGYTVFYLSLVVLIPLGGLFLKSATLSWSVFWETVTDPLVMASYRLSFGASLLAAIVNAVFGFIVAWTLVRTRFPGKRIIDAFVDLPFALPTAVSGIALCAIYAPNGWIGQYFETYNNSGFRAWAEPGYVSFYTSVSESSGWSWLTWVLPGDLEIKTAYSRIGVFIALTFIGLPFVVRTLQPAIEDLDQEVEEAAAVLGASRVQTFWKVIFPSLLPALLTGFALAFARAVGEYGSVVFISGNLPMQTQITPLMIVSKLDEYKYAEATAIAVVMLVVSFAMLLMINLLQWWSRRARGVA